MRSELEMQKAESLIQLKLTIAEVGVIISLLFSVGSLTFTAGFLYSDVQRQGQRINQLEPRVANIETRIERIDTNVTLLADLAREERTRRP